MNELDKYEHAVAIIRQAIENSRYRALKAGNAELLSLYYGIGKYVSENTRIGAWGTDAIKRIAKRLQQDLPGLRGFSETNIKYMRLFYDAWEPYVNRQPSADDLEVSCNELLLEIRQPVTDELDWKEFLTISFSHHMEIISKVKDYDERIFYIHQCAVHAWSKFTLRDYIRSDLYHNRGSLPNNFDLALSSSQYAIKAAKAFKENYLLDFINIENLGESEEDIDERVVEKEIVRNIKDFIIRFDTDFVFMGNQYRIEAAGEEMFIDLLFFNRELNCMVAVDLKAGKFRPSYLGQMTTYLTVLDDTVKKPHENPSIGLILCRDMNKAFVDYVIRDYAKPLGVATYSTTKDMSEKMKNALPDPEELKRLVLTQNVEDEE